MPIMMSHDMQDVNAILDAQPSMLSSQSLPHDHNSQTTDVHTSNLEAHGMIFPFHDENLVSNWNPYVFSIPDDFQQYILSTNISLANNLAMHDMSQLNTLHRQHVQQTQEIIQPYPAHLSQPQQIASQYYPSPVQTIRAQPPDNSPKIPSFSIMHTTAQVHSHAHTMLPPMVHSHSNDPSAFKIENHSFNQRVSSNHHTQPDPHAAGFLRQQLRAEKWDIFSARLFERRLCGSKSKSRSKTKQTGNDHEKGGASAIDFLVKVEVVKEILRTYVPHPYNPLKSLSHPYEPSPTGDVTLTRSTILSLSGWSNTQFSYWARRAEAISVLAPHDERLRSVAQALERRLRDDLGMITLSPTPPGPTPQEDQVVNVTGKGLDLIIDEIKKRTGASQFLRGKHSSLDPFGSTNSDRGNGTNTPGGNPSPPAPVYMPTFQAHAYTHSPPPGVVTAQRMHRRTRVRQGSRADSSYSQQSSGSSQDELFSSSSSGGDDSQSTLDIRYLETEVEDFGFGKGDNGVPSTPETPISVLPGLGGGPGQVIHHRQDVLMKNNRKPAENGTLRRELFPLSDSRSELENSPQKRSRPPSDLSPRKRARQSE